MRRVWSHRWDLTPKQARALQQELRGRVLLTDADDSPAPPLPERVVAVDVGYDRHTNLCAAALVVWNVAGCAAVRSAVNVQPSTFPYVPGLLSFRELPPLLPLLARLRCVPDLIVCDGQGVAHPRRAGLASHLGAIFDVPTLGWAKSRLIGTHEEPAPDCGAATALMDDDEQIGWVLRSRAGCRPTFVSPGHRLSMTRSLECARALLGRHRLCEAARAAHALTRQALAEATTPRR